MEKLKRNTDILLLLIVGFVLRFVGSFIHSYSNDELSAISRLRFDSFSDLIEFGVQKGDMHPAGVQVFMKMWAAIGGTGEMWMRFPFVLMGTASIGLLFLIGKEWFNRRVGIIAASFLTVLYFPILNSEFARPYSPGLFFALLTGYCFYRVLFGKAHQWRYAILLGVSFAAAMYTHYFAFLFVGFIGLTGLLFINQSNWKPYLVAGALGVLLFLPHLPVTLYHLNVGGLQWLGPPENDWLLQFLFHAFNSSWTVIVPVAVMAIIGLRLKPKEWKVNWRSTTIAALWFFGIYFVGHVFSLVSTPVLKFPVMLFAFPYFLLLVALVLSRVPSTGAIVAAVALLGLSSTVLERDLFGNRHYALFKEVAIKIGDWNAKYGEDNIYTIYNINNPSYMNYYANQWGDTIHFDWHELEFNSDIPIREDLLNEEKEYCIIGYSSRLTLLQTFETVREFYPEVVDYEQYNNGAVFLMKKGKRTVLGQESELARFLNYDTEKWVYDAKRVIASGDGQQYYRMDSVNIYGPEYHFTTAHIPVWENEAYLKVEIEADLGANGELTVALSGMRDGEILQHRGENYWLGHDLENMIQHSANGVGYFAFKIPEFIRPDDQLKISLWNRNGALITVKRFSILYLENKWNG